MSSKLVSSYGEQEITRISFFIRGPVLVHPLTFDVNIGFI